ncbi:MAG: hypothetical protein HUJ83_11295 [Veillonella sp.]|nr:hypothetical protein [Veillonella sp.]
MENNNFSKTYNTLNKLGYINPNADTYLWLDDMEWMSSDEINNYKYEEGELRSLIPFAHTSGGDKWVWIKISGEDDYAVGLCETEEVYGIYYAKNTEAAIVRQIIEYVAGSNFYINENDAKSYQISEDQLKLQLLEWMHILKDIISEENIRLISDLRKKHLKQTNSKYGNWYALLSKEEEEELIKEYIGFDMLNQRFGITLGEPWIIEN